MAAAPKAKPYHHGSLRQALLEGAERILEREGIQGLTLRAAAREAGASHAAPKNHFGDLTGLLSELAAIGFERFAQRLMAEVRVEDPPQVRSAAVGRGYVAFAIANPGLFLLMFRAERLDTSRPALQAAMQEAFRALAFSARVVPGAVVPQGLSLDQAADLIDAWSGVHGFALLLLDGRLGGILGRLPQGTTALDVLDTILARPSVRGAT